jgi:hypothetical protein
MRPTFRGGGNFKKPIFENLRDAFGTEPFTYADAAARVDGFNRSLCSSFRDDELLLKLTTASPYYYKISQAGTTRVRTKQEKLLLMFRMRGISRLWKYIEPRWSLKIDEGLSLLAKRVQSNDGGILSRVFERLPKGTSLNYLSTLPGNRKAAWRRWVV